jgi:hypothetical protein
VLLLAVHTPNAQDPTLSGRTWNVPGFLRAFAKKRKPLYCSCGRLHFRFRMGIAATPPGVTSHSTIWRAWTNDLPALLFPLAERERRSGHAMRHSCVVYPPIVKDDVVHRGKRCELAASKALNFAGT